MSGASDYDAIDVPVTGGSLHVGRWHVGAPGTPVLALHGVTGNHLSWLCVAEHTALPVVAPDLRGRGRSGDLPGPTGMRAHCDDLLGVLDHLGLEGVVVVGHSMGGFVATAFAEAHPERTDAVVLVDGGLPLPEPPPELGAEEVVAATIGPAAQRLSMTFADTGAYLDFWRAHPALAPSWSTQIEQYLTYDLVGDPPLLRSSVSAAAVRVDSIDLMDSSAVVRRIEALPQGTTFLRAPSGMMGDPGGLYPVDLAQQHATTWPQLRVEVVEDTNHYTIVMADRGAEAIAALLDRALPAHL